MNPRNNNKEIKTDSLKIHDNCMEFGNTIVQLSNISLVTTENISPKFPSWTIIAIVIGTILCAYSSEVRTYDDELIFLGCVGIFVGIISVVAWAAIVNLSDRINLIIITNSGDRFTILFSSLKFLNEVLDALKNIIANPSHTGNVIFNIKENTITDNGSIIRDYTEIK